MHAVESDSRVPTELEDPMLEMRGICKNYGSLRAVRSIDVTVARGQILGLLGENGAGKSTLMKILFGIVRPDAGKIFFKGRELTGHTPKDAIAVGIGMIHQHFMLVDAMTVTENVMLGWNELGHPVRAQQCAKLIVDASRTYGLEVDPDAKVGQLSYGSRQRVEIVKSIIRGADLLVLDEPTSNLSPPEVKQLLDVMRQLREQGKSVIFISHKLGEILEVCDDIVVLRDGKVIGQCAAKSATKTSLAQMMVGREVPPPIRRVERALGPEVLTVKGLSQRGASGVMKLTDINLSLHAGEIVAIAGIDGNGQADFVNVLAGLKSSDQGSILLDGRDITRANVRFRLSSGISYIPVDRIHTSLVPSMSVEENLALRDFFNPPFSRHGLLDFSAIRSSAVRRIGQFGINVARSTTPVQTLSGGNQQKIVLAREIGRSPKVLIAHQPTWGLDPGATRFVIDQVLALRDAGVAILYLSTELDEVLILGDRIAVICAGRLSEAVPREQVDVTEIGLAMAGTTALRPAQVAELV
jgi:simple sugar transport system ATP-binding protein